MRLLAVFFALAVASAARCDAPSSLVPYDPGTQGRFVTALCRDLQGNVWLGTEDNGVWRYSPAAKKWAQFHGTGDFGDAHCYALVCDRRGRVWAGTATHGVAVFDGQEWSRFGPTDGPLGVHVTALATSPKDGDVWGATESGLFRYSLTESTWAYVTHADGLPSDAVNALAFASDGTLFVGTDTDGVAVASAADDYKAWRVVNGPSVPPTPPAGMGLPSGLVTCLLVARDGTVYCGTGHGLAISHDGGGAWRYRRAGKRPGLLTEEYVTALAEDSAGHLWVGHRQSPPDVFDPKTGQPAALPAALKLTDDDVAALLPTESAMLVGGYGGGLIEVAANAHPAPAPRPSAPQFGLPLFAKPPTLAELNSLLAEVGKVAPDAHAAEPFVAALDQDWLTKGDWLGRYGRYWACLCAMSYAPLNYIWGASKEKIDYRTRMGPHHNKGDKLRSWITWKYTTNPDSLEMPPTYLDSRVRKKLTTWAVNRRQSEADDHGEAYPMERDGPSIYATVSVPDGLYVLSLYDFNKDGHDSSNRYRDYRVSVRAHVGTKLEDNAQFAAQPELAHGRIHTFWNGVWTRFLVRGPQMLTVDVDRNNSFNTILPGLMLDRADEAPPPYFHTPEQWQTLSDEREKRRQDLLSEMSPAHDKQFAPAKTESDAANRLFDALNAVQLVNPRWAMADGRRVYTLLMRWYAAQYYDAFPHVGKRLAARYGTCAYQAGQYAQWEAMQKAAGLTSARDIEKSLRWDGVTNTDHDFDVVMAYLAAHKDVQARNYGTAFSQSTTATLTQGEK